MPNIYFEKLIKVGVVFLVILSLFVLVLTVNALKQNRFIGGGVPVSNTITVSGEGEAFAVPDVASFTFSVVEKREAVDAAQTAAAEKMNVIIAFFEEQKIEEEDIRTTGYNLYPQYQYQQERIVCITFPCPQPPGRQVLLGYEVRQSVSVKVRDTEAVGMVLAGVGELGATDISGLSFTIDDEDNLMREARTQAIDDARKKAKELADDLDVKLVRVVNFYESGPSLPYYARGFGGDVALEEMGVAQAPPDIPTGENRITSNVSITYEIR